MNTNKQKKAAAIEQCIYAIADHFGADPRKAMDAKTHHKTNAEKNTRYLITYHMRRNGMSHESIARILGRSVDTIHDYQGRGSIMMMNDGHRAMVDALPKIPNTLQLQPVAP